MTSLTPSAEIVRATPDSGIFEVPSDEQLEREPVPETRTIGGELVPFSYDVLAASSATNKRGKFEQFAHTLDSIGNELHPAAIMLSDLPSGGEDAAQAIAHAKETLDDARKVVPVITLGPSGSRTFIDKALGELEGQGTSKVLLRGRVPDPALIKYIKKNFPQQEVGSVVKATASAHEGRTGNDYYYIAEEVGEADFAVTEPIFSSISYAALKLAMRENGVQKPIIPGIGIHKSIDHLAHEAAKAGKAPSELTVYEGSAASLIRETAATAFTAQLGLDLIEQGAPGLHFYTYNNPKATIRIANLIHQHLANGNS